MLLSGMLALALGAWADTLSPEAALSRALREEGSAARSRADSDYSLSHTFRYSDFAVGYMFSTGNKGFLLVSADDLAVPTLGYSDTQEFDADNIPDGLQYWLDTYAQEINWARNHSEQTSRRLSRADDREPISPLLTTKWNQDAPYNDLCPMVQGRRSVTGCVATAMAQVLNYYKYPAKGEGTVKYKIDVTRDETGNIISGTDWEFDFGNTAFDWNEMLDTYDSKATDAQKKAVATLMSACGASVEMNYSPQESGAQSAYAPQALINHFGYSNSTYVAMRENYDLEKWEELVYNQLSANGPLLYSGISATGGHAFVCDGYNGDGYFHFNWGWGGMSDGYFRLTALDPSSQGIGGSSSGYNFQQTLVCDMKPSKGGDRYYTLSLLDAYKIYETSSKIGSKISWGDGIANYSSYTFTGFVNLAYEPLNGGSITYSNPISVELPPLNVDGSISYYDKLQSNIPILSKGDYKVYPVYAKGSTNWNPVMCPIFGSTYYTAKVDDNGISFVGEAKAVPELSDVKIAPLYENGDLHLEATVYNAASAEFYGRVCAKVYTADLKDLLFESSPVMIDLLPGKSMQLEITDPLKLQKQYTGAAKVVFIDLLSGKQLGESVDVTVNKAAEAATIALGTIEFGSGYQSTQQANDLCFQVEVSCTKGYFGGYLYMYIFPNENGEIYSVGSILSEYISLESGERKDVVFKGSLLSGIDNKEYFVSIYYDENWVGGELVFKLNNKTSAVETVTDDKEGVILFDLSGRRVHPGFAPKGVYISKPLNGGKAQKVFKTSE